MIRAGLAIVFGAQLVALVALLDADDETHIVVIVPPAIVSSPPAPAAPTPPPPVSVVAAACPAPVRAVHVVSVGELPESITHVHPSPTNAAWLAAWNDRHVFVSADGGATFERVLDGPGVVADVGFDCFGRIIAVRDAVVGVRDGGDESWRAVSGLIAREPEPDAPAIDAHVIDGGPDIVIVGVAVGKAYLSRIAASSDRGATWRYRDLDRPYEATVARGRQSADGTIRAAVSIADCDYAGLEWTTWRGGHFDSDRVEIAEASTFGLYGDVVIDDGRWMSRGGAWHDIAGLANDATPIEAPWPAAVAAGTAYRIANGRATALPWCIAGSSPTIDASGRVWMIRAGAPVVAIRDHVCTPIKPPDGD